MTTPDHSQEPNEDQPVKKPFWRRWWFIALGIYVLAFGTIWGMAETDYARVCGGRKPFFTYSKAPMADGGSVEYGGLGYVVVDLHTYATPRPSWATRDGWAYDVGAELYCPVRYLWPWGPLLMKDKRFVLRIDHDHPPEGEE